jgi:sugar lactone lactonase YvrE
MQSEICIHGLTMTEGLRWHNDQLWFCDLKEKKVYSLDTDMQLNCVLHLHDEPVALGWLRNGNMLVCSLYDRNILEYTPEKTIQPYADLGCCAPGYAHDFCVSSEDFIYISASGFYPAANAKVVASPIMLIDPQGQVTRASEDIGYPNGIALLDQEHKLVVSETFAARLSLFEVSSDHQLVNRKILYQFDTEGFQVNFDANGIPKDMTRYYPDGLCFDSDRELIWVASPGRNEVVGIHLSGHLEAVIQTRAIPFDCALQPNTNKLFIASSQGGKPKEGNIEVVYL